MYKTVAKNENPPQTLQVCLKREFKVLQLSAASFFGNRGEREALAQLAIKVKKNQRTVILPECIKGWVKGRAYFLCSQSNYRYYDSPRSTHPSPMTSHNNTPPHTHKNKGNQINLRHDDTTQRDTDTNRIPSSPRTEKVAVHQLQRHRVALLHCWTLYFWFWYDRRL